MPLFFFDLDETGATANGIDETKTVLDDMEAVRETALRFLPELIKDDPRPELSRRRIGMRVRDGEGQIVYRASLVLSEGDDDEAVMSGGSLASC